MFRSVRGAAATAVAILLAGVITAPAGSAASGFVVLKSGLDNPRGVSYDDGRLFVAEAGKGGTDCPAGAKGPEGGQLCFGRTGKLISLPAGGGAVHTIQSGLISMSGLPGGLAAEGVASVNSSERGLQTLFSGSVVGVLASIPSGKSLTPSDDAALRRSLGSIHRLGSGGDTRIADVGDSDYSWSAVHHNLVPDQFPDANPNDQLRVGTTTYVADAASNTLDAVTGGYVRQLAFLPNNGSSDAVPTCVAMGPDGALYLGELAPGATANGSKIYRYSLRYHTLRVWARGLNVVDGCGFDSSGNFYATEFQSHGFNPGPSGNPAGDVIQIRHNGTRRVLGAGHLFYPQGFATDNAGHIFVSNWSIFTGTPASPHMPTGQVVRLTV